MFVNNILRFWRSICRLRSTLGGQKDTNWSVKAGWIYSYHWAL